MTINSTHTVEPGSARERSVLGVSLALGALILLLDQWSKVMVEQTFILHESKVLGRFLSLTYVENYGAAWSLFHGYGWALVAVALLVLAGAFYFLRYLTEGFMERYVALFLVIGGVIGNSIDRIWRGAVVDFLDFHYERWHWPVFNIADIAICVGVGIFVLSNLLRRSSRNLIPAAGEKPEKTESLPTEK